MSLLIKALDKAQEEAQTAKGKQKAKQSEAELALQAKTAPPPHHKRQPAALNPALNEPSRGLSTTASEKLAAATALELELSPKIKPDTAFKPALNIQYQPQNSEQTHVRQAEAAVPLPSKVFTPGTSNMANVAADNINASKTNAANVFAAKRIEANHQNSKIAFIVGVGVIVLSAIGAYFYHLADSGSDLTFLAKRPLVPVATPQTVQAQPAETVALNQSSGAVSTNIDAEKVVAEPAATRNNPEASLVEPQKLAKAMAAINSLRLAQNEKAFDTRDAESQNLTQSKQRESSYVGDSNKTNLVQIASKSASIQVSKNTEQASVNPVLMRAYDAYNAGNDTEAIKLYKQVLQRDVRNVDALLGLGAIAQRQGRLQDANGWYGKVLELEPKNSIALGFNLVAHLDNQAPNDVNSESRIKNMLAKQPDDAGLHATLGNYYADSNQWSDAQQAYFDAYRLNPSADNAFNLAISLDQLGKPKLALPYYQRALQLSQANASNIDKLALEARIAAIQ